MSKIGIGISTRNRSEVFKKSYAEWLKFLPKDAKLVVVDDASDIPVEGAIRNENKKGIATVKNQLLEALDDCDHLFICDDDIYPLKDKWWEPYIQSEEPHLMYMFTQFAVPTSRPLKDCKEIYRGEIVAYTHPRGCLLYIDRKVLDVVGGFDTSFGGSMYEHSDWSNRIYAAGLTTFRYMDVPGSEDLFHSMDEYAEVKSSIPFEERRENIIRNKPIYSSQTDVPKYCEYRTRNQNNIILTAYFTSQPDPQTGENWEPDYKKLQPLIKSVPGKLVILHDCFDVPDTENVKHVKVNTHFNPYFQRWMEYYRYLRDHPEIDNVFIVDSTDVEVLKNPFEESLNRIYVGQEDSRLGCPWMLRHNSGEIKQFILRNRNKKLLNCGVVGGRREDIMLFSRDILSFVGQSPFEMGPFNYLCYTKYLHKIETGITTRFKKYEYDYSKTFKHK